MFSSIPDYFFARVALFGKIHLVEKKTDEIQNTCCGRFRGIDISRKERVDPDDIDHEGQICDLCRRTFTYRKGEIPPMEDSNFNPKQFNQLVKS